MPDIQANIRRHLSNIPGWRTRRKIVVFESDDWGSIRMPSDKTFKKLTRAGIDLSSADSLRYNLNDTLANAEDLAALFEVLSSIKDSINRPCVFTAVSVVANPDFDKIKAFDFTEYHYEPFTDTLKKYPGCKDSFSLWQEGFRKNIFIPQFHSREHLNVKVWLDALQKNDRDTRLAFKYGMWGFNNRHPYNISYQAAFELNDLVELKYHRQVITDGLTLFEKIHGFRAAFFVPPNGSINNNLEETAAKHGIKYMSASRMQPESIGFGKTRYKIHWLGQKNRWGQRYMTRNCFFEPGIQGKDWVSSCLSDISMAFRWNKPAIISTHRVNYIGGINPANRDNGLLQLTILIKAIVNNWPDIEFMDSDSLGNIISAHT
jgi:hypothetical protein